jgi:hypothetical protein
VTAKKTAKKVTVKLPPAIAGFTFGVVTAVKSGGKIQVKVRGQKITARCPRDISPSVGDVVVMVRYGSAMWVLNRYFVDSKGNVDLGGDDPPGPGTVVSGTTTFLPKFTGSYRRTVQVGWRADGDHIYQGATAQGNNIGCAFYGDQMIPLAGVTVVSGYITARRGPGGPAGAQTTTLWGLTQSTKPSGMPTLSGVSFTGPSLQIGATGRTDLHISVAQGLVDGTYGGLAVYDSDGAPYVRLNGRREYAGSFAVTLKWRRE